MATVGHAFLQHSRKFVATPTALIRLGNRTLPVCTCRPLTALQCTNDGGTDYNFMQVRYMSRGRGRGGFISSVIENLKQDYGKDKEFQENIKKFREETKKLEESETLKKAREKFKNIELESQSEMRKRLSESIEEVKKKESVKQFTEQAGKVAGKVGETADYIGQSAAKGVSKLGEMETVKNLAEGVKGIAEAMDIDGYKKPEQLLKRADRTFKRKGQETVEAEPNLTDTDVVLHKDSKFYERWQNFKDNNQYINKILDFKVKYDESDHLAVRMTRAVTGRVGRVLGGIFTPNETSKVLTEVMNLEPSFDREKFERDIRTVIMPTIFEALDQGRLDVVEDWCYEAVYGVLTHPIDQCNKLGYKYNLKTQSIGPVEIANGIMFENRYPCLIVTFESKQLEYVEDKNGEVKEGSKSTLYRVYYQVVFRRDIDEPDPKLAWRILELGKDANPLMF